MRCILQKICFINTYNKLLYGNVAIVANIYYVLATGMIRVILGNNQKTCSVLLFLVLHYSL
jgi:hypothetical protein